MTTTKRRRLDELAQAKGLRLTLRNEAGRCRWDAHDLVTGTLAVRGAKRAELECYLLPRVDSRAREA